MELEQTIRDWGAPEWATPAIAAWIRSGGTIDRDLWIALRAAAREAPNDRPGRRVSTTKPPADRDTGPAHSVVVGNNIESTAPGAASAARAGVR